MTSTAGPSDASEGGEEPDARTRDEIFEVLSNSRRRYALHYLLQRSGEASKRELSRQIAAWENDVSPREVTPEMRRSVYIALHQVHVPKLAEAGLIAVDTDGCEVALTDDAERIRPYVDAVGPESRRWSRVYLGLAGLGGLVVGLSAAGIWPFARLPVALWSLLTAGLVGATSLADLRRRGRTAMGSDGRPPGMREAEPRGDHRGLLGELRSWIAERLR